MAICLLLHLPNKKKSLKISYLKFYCSLFLFALLSATNCLTVHILNLGHVFFYGYLYCLSFDQVI